MKLHRYFLLFLALISVGNSLGAQELEPRRWAHLPSGINFFGMGTAYTFGDINFDPVINIEEAEVDTQAITAAYIRSFDFFGKSGRVDFNLPYAKSHWQGLLNGEPASLRLEGPGDAGMRLSVNLIGAPVLRGEEYASYIASNPVTTTMGVAVAITAPTGEYTNERLINLGSNRWIVRPQLGFLHQRNKWQFELTGSVFLFGDNDDFWLGTVHEQDPLWFLQGHIVHTFRPGLWASVSTGYGYGGRSHVNGDPKNNDSRVGYWKLSVGVPINRRMGLNFSFAAARTNTHADADLDRLAVSWSMMFGN